MSLPGDRRIEYDHEWVWVPADVERGHWLATDHTRITIFPASDGIEDLQVFVPVGNDGKEMVLHLAPELEDAAFRYAASARRMRGH